MQLDIQNHFTSHLPADPELDNHVRKVFNACFSYVTPTPVAQPRLIHAVSEVAATMGISQEDITSPVFLDYFSGNAIASGAKPYAMCYGGHQFGNWAGQLGDGRAITLFDFKNNNQLYSVQLKGAGKTPYSRTADGLAVLRSSIREYLCAEAMHHLGIPTSRSLCLINSGNMVLRDILYNGNPALEQGAIVARVAPSFIRFGNFEIFAARNDKTNLEKLTHYTITHHYPEIQSVGEQKYLDFFQKVAQNTLQTILNWQRVGFVHGVMNTDNMSIHGITIDYGPYGWLEDYNPNWTPNTTDIHYKRYRFDNQPEMALYNLYQLANALHLLINQTNSLKKILDQYSLTFAQEYHKMMSQKIGLPPTIPTQIITQLLQTLQLTPTDYTIFFRLLSSVHSTDSPQQAIQKITNAFYTPNQVQNTIAQEWHNWFNLYLQQLQTQSTTTISQRTKQMNSVNPKYVLRNYMAQMAIEQAEKNDYTLLNQLFTMLKNPYTDQPENQQWFAKRPEWANNKIGCSMLSCSS